MMLSKRFSKVIIPLVAFFLLFPCVIFAQQKYTVDPTQSTIEGSIKYTLIGRYKAHFEEFTGGIHFDPQNLTKTSVVLKVKTKSIKSRFPKLDRMVLSPRLLNAHEFPEMIFESKSIEERNGKYYVTGIFNLRGIKKEMTLPFSIEGPFIDKKGRGYLIASGKWLINRKAFNFVWNKFLDKGGIIVGNTITLDWKMMAFRENPGPKKK